jgi:octaprenyl-diphosphate synthase
MTLLLAGKCFGAGREERFFEMAAVVELAHSATLLHDDVVDEGMERRGAPTARRIFGNGVSVLAGDMLLIDALKRTERSAPALLSQLIETLSRLVNGEIVQLRGRTELDVSEVTYDRILRDKTASLFSFAASAGAQMAGANEAEQEKLAHFGESLGMAFQLVDDVIDYEGNQSGKTLLADLMEGKLTLPLVLAVQKDPTLSDLVAQIHAGDSSSIDEVSRRVLKSGSCEEVRARALDHTEKAVEALSQIQDSPAKGLMAVVAREMTRRVA